MFWEGEGPPHPERWGKVAIMVEGIWRHGLRTGEKRELPTNSLKFSNEYETSFSAESVEERRGLRGDDKI